MKFHSVKNPTDSTIYVISLERGEYINKSIEAFCLERKIFCAHFSGIGAIRNPEVSKYHGLEKGYQGAVLEGSYELVALVGNIGRIENGDEKDGIFCHSHVAFSDSKFTMYGGHLVETEVEFICEIYLHAFSDLTIIRKRDAVVGLNTIC